MNKKLLEFNSYQKDYLKWAKAYSIFKLYEFDKSKVEDSFDVVALEENLLEANTINELHKVNNFINKNGLKQSATLSMAMKRFFAFTKDKVNSFNELNSNSIEAFVNKHCMDKKLQYGTRNNYKNNLVAFLTFVTKDNSDKFKFKLESVEVISNADDKKSNTKLADWMDSKMVKEFIKKIVSYPFENDFEKCRDILIARLFICGGLELNELINITEKSFIFEPNEMSIKIVKSNGRERIVPLPKALFIRYYNEYLKLKDSSVDTFFYNSKYSNKSIEANLVRTIVERLVIFTKIKVRDKTPQMLRLSWIIFIHNEKDENGFTQPLKNVQELSGIENITDLKKKLQYPTIEVVTTSKVFEDLNLE